MQSAVGSDEEELAAGSGSIVNCAPGVVVAELPTNGSEITSSKSMIVTFGLCRMDCQLPSAQSLFPVRPLAFLAFLALGG